MRVYLIAAPEDETHAQELAAYLKRFGVSIRTEFGGFGYPPAHHGEFTMALWSRAAMMSVRRIQVTNRAIDAWSEGRLVMAKLEHGLSPQGLRDLEMIDLTFEAAREHRYRDVLTALRGLEDAARMPSEGQAPGGSSSSGAKQAPASHDVTEMRAPPPQAAPSPVADAKSSSGGLLWLFGLGLLVFAALVGSSIWLTDLLPSGVGEVVGSISPILYVLPLVVGLMLLAGLILSLRRTNAPKRKPARREAKPAMPSEAPVSEPEAAMHDIFVSYSHQNAQTVLPIVETVEQSGVSIWIDREEMRAGQTWAGQIVRAIKASGRFCLMCSEQAFASDHVRREVYLADKYGKDMVPVRLDETEMPEDIEYFLIGKQWIDLTSLPNDEHARAIQKAISGAAS